MKMPKTQMATVNKGADDCYAKASETNDKFETWLFHACELHTTCVQESSTTEELLQAAGLNMVVA